MSKAFSKEIEEYRKFYAENKDIIKEAWQLMSLRVLQIKS